MTDERTCPHCGKPVPPTALQGICPECMLKAGLAAQTEGPEGPHGTKIVPPPPAEIAALFPQLEILECLGRGGMGVVYKARQPRLNRLVALKILARDKEPNGRFDERFTREAQALARLNHPNIVTVHDFGEAGGNCYLLMEFVDGLNLRELLQSGKMPPAQALAIVPKICEALQFAHEHGIVHRDIKPENILMDKQGRVKIADFGIAKMLGAETGPQMLTGARDVVGTPHYMAPEQIEKPMEVDHRADIYSLGVVFYEMLTGELPLGKFAAPSKKVQVDVRLDEVVLRALEKEPALRYQQASAFRTHVETIAAGPQAPAPARTQTGPDSRRQFISLTVVNVLAAVVMVFAGWVAYEFGAFFNLLFVLILLMIPIRVALILGRLFVGSLEYRLWRTPLAPGLVRQRWQVGNRWIFWLLTAAVLKVCIVPAQFSAQENAAIRLLVWGGILVVMLLELLPGKRIYLGTNLAFAAGSILMATQLAVIHAPMDKSEGCVLAAPFQGEWLVLNGGPSALINGHYTHSNQRDALDIERVVDGKERTGDRKQLESYPSWGQTLYAPADGTVVTAENNREDNPVGKMDREHLVGNHIMLDIGGDRFVLMAHLQKGSLQVAAGDVVRAGQPIAKCGNSGNTSHPHLHIQVQNLPEFSAPGVRTYPILFSNVTLERSGRRQVVDSAFVRHNDKIIAQPQTLESSAADSNGTRVFGPVIERVLNDPDDEPQNSFLDLETGQLFDIPVPPLTGNVSPELRIGFLLGSSESLMRGVREHKIDLMGDASGGSLLGYDLATVAVANDRFDDAQPVEVDWQAAEGRQRDAPSSTVSLHASNTPATWYFKTREGGTGILQITGFTASPHAAKIRYRNIITLGGYPPPNAGSREAALREAIFRNTSVKEWFSRMENDVSYTALNALIKKANESDEVRTEIIRTATALIDDPKENETRRWESCYVLSGIQDARGIPVLTRALADRSVILQGVAACALGAFRDPAARSALEAAAMRENSPAVDDWIQRALKGEFRK